MQLGSLMAENFLRMIFMNYKWYNGWDGCLFSSIGYKYYLIQDNKHYDEFAILISFKIFSAT
jgi:hypothetical protein